MSVFVGTELFFSDWCCVSCMVCDSIQNAKARKQSHTHTNTHSSATATTTTAAGRVAHTHTASQQRYIQYSRTVPPPRPVMPWCVLSFTTTTTTTTTTMTTLPPHPQPLWRRASTHRTILHCLTSGYGTATRSTTTATATTTNIEPLHHQQNRTHNMNESIRRGLLCIQILLSCTHHIPIHNSLCTEHTNNEYLIALLLYNHRTYSNIHIHTEQHNTKHTQTETKWTTISNVNPTYRPYDMVD